MSGVGILSGAQVTTDGVVGCVFGPALIAVRVEDFGVVIAEAFEGLAGHLGERFDDFHGVNVDAHGGEDGGLVAGAGPDFQNLFAGLGADGFGHEGDDVGLGDGLAVSDGERVVGIGLAVEAERDEFVARDGAHGFECGGVGDAAGGDLLIDHGGALGGEVGGGSRRLGVGAGREEEKAEERDETAGAGDPHAGGQAGAATGGRDAGGLRAVRRLREDHEWHSRARCGSRQVPPEFPRRRSGAGVRGWRGVRGSRP